MTLGIRPENLGFARVADNAIPATVALVEYLGDVTLAYVQVDGVSEMVALKCDAGVAPPERGARVQLAIPAARAHLFGADGAALPRARAPTITTSPLPLETI